MHGSVAPLPELAAVAKGAGALLMVDEAHATGVVGATGRGSEELFGLPGGIDVLMGTFSKAAGAAGGYVVGPRDLVDYLRFFARSAVFTASLPASVFAAVAEAFRLMDEDPAPRERLHENARRFTARSRRSALRPSPRGPRSSPSASGRRRRSSAPGARSTTRASAAGASPTRPSPPMGASFASPSTPVTRTKSSTGPRRRSRASPRATDSSG